MKRRNFLKTSIIGTGAIMMFPYEVLGNTSSLKGVNLIHPESNLVINIPFGSDGYVDVHDVYWYIKELWRNDENLIKYPFPMIAIHNWAIEIINDWEFTERSFEHLNNGSITIEKTGEHYTGVCVLGNTMSGFDTKLEIDGKVYEQNSIIANIENKDIIVQNGDGTKRKCAHEYIGRYDTSTRFYGVWYMPPVYFDRIDLSK